VPGAGGLLARQLLQHAQGRDPTAQRRHVRPAEQGVNRVLHGVERVARCQAFSSGDRGEPARVIAREPVGAAAPRGRFRGSHTVSGRGRDRREMTDSGTRECFLTRKYA
jgi:hypothetical protein